MSDSLPDISVLGALLAVAVVLALLAAWFVLRRSVTPVSGLPELSSLTRGTRHMAFAVLLLFFGVFGAWAAIAPLSAAAIAEGVVSPDGARRSIQHLEGGIIRAIHVRDGDHVTQGDPLLTLEDIQARADNGVLRERYLHLTVTGARLEAEQTMAESLEVATIMAAAQLPEDARPVAEAQVALFADRRAALDGRRRVLTQQIRQLEEENRGLEEAILGEEEQISLLQQEIGNVQSLFDKGLAEMPRLLALKRERAQVRIERAQNRSRIARNMQEVGQTEIEITNLAEDWRERAGHELSDTRTELAEILSRLPQTRDALRRTVIAAPLSGTVLELAFTTPGGVIRPGERILDIVPDNADLLIDARVRVQDIDDVRPGLEAKVVLSAYSQRNMPTVLGRVRDVSADRIRDPRTNESYYLAHISVDRSEVAAIGHDVKLVAGMPAEVMIRTAEQTFLDYLMTPVLRSFDRSFRES